MAWYHLSEKPELRTLSACHERVISREGVPSCTTALASPTKPWIAASTVPHSMSMVSPSDFGVSTHLFCTLPPSMSSSHQLPAEEVNASYSLRQTIPHHLHTLCCIRACKFASRRDDAHCARRVPTEGMLQPPAIFFVTQRRVRRARLGHLRVCSTPCYRVSRESELRTLYACHGSVISTYMPFCTTAPA